MNFSQALDKIKSGLKLQRNGWNGKNMWIEMQFPDEYSKITVPYIFMKTADNQLVPWLASQTDIFAEDWSILL